VQGEDVQHFRPSQTNKASIDGIPARPPRDNFCAERFPSHAAFCAIHEEGNTSSATVAGDGVFRKTQHGQRRLVMNKQVMSLLIAGVIALTASAASAQTFRVEGAGAEANPPSYSGKCPGLIKFTGKIQASGKGRVKFTWVGSDGATGPVEYLDFEEAGVKHVSTTWTLGDARWLPSYEGWQEIRILSPNEMVSNRATFKLTCNDLETARKPDLVISEASLALGQICLPYHPILLATALVKNIGDAKSPERFDVGLVGAIEDSSGWGNGVGLPALAPGSTHRVEFPIYYLIDNPAHMDGRHAFPFRVNSGLWIEESNTGNNDFGCRQR
jgi:hypothetical protein